MTAPRYHTSTPLDARKQQPIEARRRHIYGPLIGLEPPPGEWPLWAGVALMFAMGLVGTLLCAAVGG